MVINKEDLSKLIEVENTLFEKNMANEFYILFDIIDKLLYQREQTNKKNYARIKAKRQTNKNYARPKKGDKK